MIRPVPEVEEHHVVESAALPEGTVRMPAERLHDFSSRVFAALGVPTEAASLAADVLVAADLRGIRSHGVARLPYFAVRLRNGVINRTPDIRYERRTSTTGSLDADNGLGMVAAQRALDEAIAMAADHGSGFVTTHRSNHFGFAGYWVARAMERGYIGVAMANSGRRVAPTFGREALLGTNPVAVGIPGGDGDDFLLDMATSTVAVGKVETALRERGTVPGGWVTGDPRLDDRGVLTYDAPLLPLGGEGEATGGHKGYGLSLLVELLCGAVAGSALADRIEGAAGRSPAAMGQFIGVFRRDSFREPAAIEEDMASTFSTLRAGPTTSGHDRVLIHGEPEREAEAVNRTTGLPVTPRLLEQLRALDGELDLGFGL